VSSPISTDSRLRALAWKLRETIPPPRPKLVPKRRSKSPTSTEVQAATRNAAAARNAAARDTTTSRNPVDETKT